MKEIVPAKLLRNGARYLGLVFLIQTATSVRAAGQSLSVSGVISTPITAVRYASITFIDNSDPAITFSAVTNDSGKYQISAITAVRPPVNQPTSFKLAQNYPNPFSSATDISYDLNKPSVAKVTIYDVLGRKVRTFDVGEQDAGIHSVTWNGRNSAGRIVAPGVYFYRLQADGRALVRKMVFGVGPTNASPSFPGVSTFSGQSSEKKSYAPLLGETFTVRIANTDSTVPFITDESFDDVELQSDTAMNFTVAGSGAVVKDSVIYTLSVSEDTLGVRNTLNAALSVFNRSTTKKTFEVGASAYSWSLTNSSGQVVLYGPTVISLVLVDVGVEPGQSVELYGISEPYLGARLKAGTYVLHFSLGGPLTFQTTVWLDKDGQVSDTSGVITPIYPLKIGSTWTFCRSYYANDGSLLGTDTTTQSILTEFLINDQKIFLLSSTTDGFQLISAGKDGIYNYFPDLDTAVLLYKYPATAGESYNSGYELGTGNERDTIASLPMTVDSTNEVLSVTAGKFTCYKYTQHGISTTIGGATDVIPSKEVYLSKVGPVEENEGGIVTELVSTNF